MNLPKLLKRITIYVISAFMFVFSALVLTVVAIAIKVLVLKLAHRFVYPIFIFGDLLRGLEIIDLLNILVFAILGVGALSIYLIEIQPSKVILNVACLWALFISLLIVLFLYKSIFPPVILLSTSQITIMGILIGLFWKGRPYWR